MLCLLIMSNLTLKRKTTKTKLQNLTPEDLGKCPNRHTKDLVIQPSVAQWILDNRNSKPIDRVPEYTNRNMRTTGRKTELLIRDILDNNFYPCLISFDKKGWVLNGQHRLYAITKAEKACEMIVEFGAKRESMVKIDRGQPRSIKDILGLHLFQEWGLNPSRWGNVSKIGINFFGYVQADKRSTSRLYSSLCDHNPTDKQVVDFFNDNKEIILRTEEVCRGLRSSLQMEMQVKNKKGSLVTRSNRFLAKVFFVPLACLMALDKKLAESFIYDLQTKDSKSNPAAYVKEYLRNGEAMNSRAEYLNNVEFIFGAIQKHIDSKSIVSNKVKRLREIK